MPNPEKLSKSIVGKPGALPIVTGSGVRVNESATSSSSTEAALPAGSRIIELRSTENIWIRFGNIGVGAAAADANSILFLAGEKAMPVPVDATGVPFDYFRVLRAGSTDAIVQIERINAAQSS